MCPPCSLHPTVLHAVPLLATALASLAEATPPTPLPALTASAAARRLSTAVTRLTPSSASAPPPAERSASRRLSVALAALASLQTLPAAENGSAEGAATAPIDAALQGVIERLPKHLAAALALPKADQLQSLRGLWECVAAAAPLVGNSAAARASLRRALTGMCSTRAGPAIGAQHDTAGGWDVRQPALAVWGTDMSVDTAVGALCRLVADTLAGAAVSSRCASSSRAPALPFHPGHTLDLATFSQCKGLITNHRSSGYPHRQLPRS